MRKTQRPPPIPNAGWSDIAGIPPAANVRLSVAREVELAHGKVLERQLDEALSACRHAEEALRQSELLLVEQTRSLALIASGRPLDECLVALCVAVPRLNPQARAAILLADSARTSFARCITPDLPPSFGQGIHGKPINELAVSTCSSAIYSGKAVACVDIANDDTWSMEWRELCIGHGIRACHSTPVLGADGLPCASFVLYSGEPHPMNEWEQRLADFGANGARIAIEHDRSNQALRESEERFRSFAENSADGLWFADARTGVLEYLSPVFDRMWGVKREDFLGHLGRWAELLHPEDHASAIDHIERLTAGEVRLHEHRIIRESDGAVRWIRDTGFPIRDETGTVRRVAGIAQDVTDEKAADARELWILEEAQAARAEAEAANRVKSDFLATMSHELRTPLNAIIGHVQLVEMGIHGPVAEAQLVALGRAQRSGQYLLSLINDVLNFAKLEAGRLEYDIANVPLMAVVAEVIAMVESQLAAKGITCEARVAPNAVARADGEKLRQILLNLFTNAVKFTQAGGRLTVNTRADDGTSDGRVFLCVSDTGIGIPLEMQDVVFDPFVQVRPELTRTVAGTGLGLTISRDLARGMGGELTVKSTPGVGSTFTVALPAA